MGLLLIEPDRLCLTYYRIADGLVVGLYDVGLLGAWHLLI